MKLSGLHVALPSLNCAGPFGASRLFWISLVDCLVVIECHRDLIILIGYWHHNGRSLSGCLTPMSPETLNLMRCLKLLQLFTTWRYLIHAKKIYLKWIIKPYLLICSRFLLHSLYIHSCPIWQGEPREPAFEQAEEIFKALDVNGDGSLDEEEFVK